MPEKSYPSFPFAAKPNPARLRLQVLPERFLTHIDLALVLPALLACFLGGVLKGATGAGAPVIGVPVLAALTNVQFAVAVFVTSNVLTNVKQAWEYRKAQLPWPFMVLFAGGGALGAIAGTFLLAGLPSDTLSIAMATVVLGYVGFRIFKADWMLSYAAGLRLSGPIGFLGGALQGATGISAPASITFLNALKLPRSTFIATISVFFIVMSIGQIEQLIMVGLLDWYRFFLGLGVTVAISLFMPLGNYLARHLSKETFDKIMLGLLTLIAAKILVQELFF